MSNSTKEIEEVLATQDEEFRHWIQEHHQHEERLALLTQKSTLTVDEELEEKHLKKRKLFLKDQMAARIRGYETRAAHA